MIDHIGIYISDFDAGKQFYTSALGPLGYALLRDFPEWTVAGLGSDGHPDFWIMQREAPERAHIAFRALSKDAVNAFHSAGIQAGGTDNGAPGYRTDYGTGYYAAFIIDPFGNNLEAVFHEQVS